MGLRPTNSDENHVRQAPRLRPPLTPPEQGLNKLRWVFDRARVLQDPPFALGISRSKRERVDVDVGRRTGVLPRNLWSCSVARKLSGIEAEARPATLIAAPGGGSGSLRTRQILLSR